MKNVKLLSAKDAAKALGVHPTTITLWLRKNLITGRRKNTGSKSHWWISVEEVARAKKRIRIDSRGRASIVDRKTGKANLIRKRATRRVDRGVHRTTTAAGPEVSSCQGSLFPSKEGHPRAVEGLPVRINVTGFLRRDLVDRAMAVARATASSTAEVMEAALETFLEDLD